MFVKPGNKAPNRAALAKWGSWVNAFARKEYGRSLFIACSADLADSTNISGFAKDFDDMPGWGWYQRNENTRGTLLPQEITEFTTGSQRVLIGRKLNSGEDAEATPVYILKMEVGDRIGPTEVVVRIKRRRATKEEEETLEVESVTGVVAGEDAFLDENVTFGWRTLADERYYLDTGGLDNIEVGQLAAR